MNSETQFQIDNEFETKEDNFKVDYESEYRILQIKFNSLLHYAECLYNENMQYKYCNTRLRSQLSSTSKNLAEKEKMFLLLKSIHNINEHKKSTY